MARAYQGGDKALDRVRTLKFSGTIENVETGETSLITLWLKKPDMQRQELEVGEAKDTRVVAGLEGWRQITIVDEEGQTRVRTVLLPSEEIRAMQAMTWENLYFHEGIERVLGRVKHMGTKEFEEREVYVLRFEHRPGVYFDRHFDVETGKLIATGTDGQLFVDDGEVVVQGIKFPATQQMRGEDGEVVNIITFENIEVNAPIEDSLFEVPSVQRASAARSNPGS